jgi:hypothetical protein
LENSIAIVMTTDLRFWSWGVLQRKRFKKPFSTKLYSILDIGNIKHMGQSQRKTPQIMQLLAAPALELCTNQILLLTSQTPSHLTRYTGNLYK